MHLPKYPVPKDGDAGDYLRQLCLVGLKKRFKGKTFLMNILNLKRINSNQ